MPEIRLGSRDIVLIVNQIKVVHANVYYLQLCNSRHMQRNEKRSVYLLMQCHQASPQSIITLFPYTAPFPQQRPSQLLQQLIQSHKILIIPRILPMPSRLRMLTINSNPLKRGWLPPHTHHTVLYNSHSTPPWRVSSSSSSWQVVPSTFPPVVSLAGAFLLVGEESS